MLVYWQPLFYKKAQLLCYPYAVYSIILFIFALNQKKEIMTKVTNTSKEDPFIKLFNSMSGGIEAQESRGQQELVESSQLPRKNNSYGSGEFDLKDQYKKMGINVIGETKGDELFFDVQLPKGWEVKCTDHSMWNKLVDNKGRERAMIFYKAAFCDRDSFIGFNTRFTYRCETKERISNYSDIYDRIRKEIKFGQVKDCEEIIFKTGELIYKVKYEKDQHREWWIGQEQMDQDLRKLAEDFLKEKYPNHSDINAYWD